MENGIGGRLKRAKTVRPTLRSGPSVSASNQRRARRSVEEEGEWVEVVGPVLNGHDVDEPWRPNLDPEAPRGEPRFNERRITGANGSRWFFQVYTATNAHPEGECSA
jgi:hypothetical protein